ncbi:hypothetical protein ACIBEA_38935 [Streptomyces sp. NPDC051555]|uniref:hypothetical protein n=1 Tax=Streptomyces sp. NPDC051555 TaxID=3365657 RepID=UPI0037A37D8D
MNIERLHLPLEPNGHWFRSEARAEAVRIDGVLLLAGGTPNCRACGVYPSARVVGGVAEVEEPCPDADGITTTVTIEVPSGKLLVSDSLRSVFSIDHDAFTSLDSARGQAQVIEAMAALGCAFGPATNCDLGLFRTGPDTYIMARPEWDEDDTPSLADSSRMASVCTDLWAYSCADFEHWQARGGDPADLDWSDTVVDVAPGTYRFVQHSGERGFDFDGPGTVIFAHVDRIS